MSIDWRKGLKLWENALDIKCNNDVTHKTEAIIDTKFVGKARFALKCLDCDFIFPLRAENLKECVEKWIDASKND